MLVTPSSSLQCRRSQAISLLLANDLRLLRQLFDDDGRRLTAMPSDLLEWAKVCSSGQQILVQIALDIWSGEGGVRLDDAIFRLDSLRFEGFMLAMECLRYGKISINK